MERRQFIIKSALATVGTTLLSNMANAATLITGNSDKWGSIMPMRPLGKTGEKITILGLGGSHNARLEDTDAERQIEMAIEAGIRFFDTAYVYSGGKSEENYGKFLNPKYRDEIFLMTKSTGKSKKEVEDQIHTSLKRMKTDRIDLALIHMIKDKADVDQRHNGEAFDALRKFQSDGVIRHIGYSCHTHASVALYFLDLIKDDDFICSVMTPVNPVDASDPDNSFIRMLMPEIIKRGHSHFAMKTLGGGGLTGGRMDSRREMPKNVVIPDHLSLEENVNFVLSQPVSTWVSGVDNLEQWKENIALAKSYSEISESEKKEIIKKVAGFYKDSAVETYKAAQG